MKKSYLIILGAVSLTVFAINILSHNKAHDYMVQVSTVPVLTNTAFPPKNTKLNGIAKNPIMYGTDSFTNLDNEYLSKIAEKVSNRKEKCSKIEIKKNTKQSIVKYSSDFSNILRPTLSKLQNDGENTTVKENNFTANDFLDSPTNLKLTSVSSSEITFGWQKTDGAIGYNIYYCEDKTTHLLDCKSINVETNKATLQHLNPESKYEIDIVALSMKGNPSDSSEIIFAETLIEDSDTIEIPDFYNNEPFVIESTCYNDCANTYAIKASQGYYFDFSECTIRCKI